MQYGLPGAVVAALRQQREIDDSLISHLAPLGWHHINLTGDYVWHANKRIAKGRFRPIARQEIDRVALAHEKIRFLKAPPTGRLVVRRDREL